MSKLWQTVLTSLIGVALVVGVLYSAGYRIVSPSGKILFAKAGSGGGRISKSGGGGQNRVAAGGGQNLQAQQGGGGQGRQNQAGSGQGRRNKGGGAGGQGGQGQRASAGRQPGFGPSGGILLPSKIGTDAISVLVGGKSAASFVGQDLIDHVEDTVVATADGPRKGWAIEKTLKYLGIDQYESATLVGPGGKKVTVTAQQIADPQTIPLFTYDEQGRLMVVSGPKVRGTNKGNISIDDVKKIVAGRTDLLNVAEIQTVEVKG